MICSFVFIRFILFSWLFHSFQIFLFLWKLCFILLFFKFFVSFFFSNCFRCFSIVSFPLKKKHLPCSFSIVSFFFIHVPMFFTNMTSIFNENTIVFNFWRNWRHTDTCSDVIDQKLDWIPMFWHYQMKHNQSFWWQSCFWNFFPFKGVRCVIWTGCKNVVYPLLLKKCVIILQMVRKEKKISFR